MTLAKRILGKSTIQPLLTEKCFKTRGWKTYYHNDLVQYTNFCIYQLNHMKVERGDRIVYRGKNSIEWLAWNMACNAMGAIWVPVYDNQMSKYYEHIFHDCQPKLVLSSNEKDWKDISVPHLSNTIEKEVYYHPTETIKENEIATLIYTSGTTGSSKGVILTNENILSNVGSIYKMYFDTTNMKSLNILPWAHVYGQTCELYYNLIYDHQTILCSDKENFIKECRLFQPTVLFLVPFVLQQIQMKIKVFDKPGLSWIIPSLLQQLLGKNVQMIFVGGASLPQETANFFKRHGIRLCQGYGSTETSPMISLNHWKYPRNEDSVGYILDDVHVKIIDNEICVKGPNVMQGYWNHPKLDQKEWYRTGDTGYVKDNFLFYTGRQKENFKLSNGRFMNVNEFEKRLRKDLPHCNFIICYQDGIVLISDTKINVNLLNRTLPSHEKIKKFHYIDSKILKEKFMTPKMSVKRFALQQYIFSR